MKQSAKYEAYCYSLLHKIDEAVALKVFQLSVQGFLSGFSWALYFSKLVLTRVYFRTRN